MGVWKIACKWALGEVLSDKACVLKLAALRQEKKKKKRKIAGWFSTATAHKYISAKAVKYTICVRQLHCTELPFSCMY